VTPMTSMAAEIAEAPEAAARFLRESGPLVDAIARELSGCSFPFAVICGRGSSSHAGVYLRYLLEAMLGIAVSPSAPSVVTSYGRPPRVTGALFVVISQSGRSPDLVSATRAARQGGALTLALVNDPASPVAAAAETVLPLAAGPERAVAATKTVLNSLLAAASLVARWADDPALTEAVRHLPERLRAAQALDWSAWTDDLQGASAAFVTGRGHGFGPIKEIALKMSETLRLPALAYSSAELRHGPRGALGARTPVLALRQDDPAAESVDALVRDLREDGIRVRICGAGGDLPWIGDDHPACDPIAMLLPAYRAIEREAVRRGLDPDRPAGLTKVTETL